MKNNFVRRLFPNKRILFLATIIIVSNFIVTSISLVVNYYQSISTLESTLSGIVQRQKSLVTMLHEQGMDGEEIIVFIQEIREKYSELGHMGEFVIGQKTGDTIIYLLSTGTNRKLPFNNPEKFGWPMHLALENNVGTVKAKDYIGTPVLAAYTYVPSLKWGIVAKIPVKEINQSYYKAGLTAIIITLVLIVCSILIFFKISTPIVKSLLESEVTYRMLFESINDAVFISEILDNEKIGKFIKVNEIACKRLGYSESELLEKTPYDISPVNAYTKSLSVLPQLFENGQAIFETEHLSKYGKIIPVEVSSKITKLKDKTIIHSIVRDITERKISEQALREKTEVIEAQNEEYSQINEELSEINIELQLSKERAEESEARFRSIIENTEAGYFFIDNEGFFRKVNKAWINLYKYNSFDEVIGKHFVEVQQLEDIDAARKFVEGIKKGIPEYMCGSFSRLCKDKSTGYHTFSARPVYQGSKIIGIEGFIIDTTKQKEWELELLKSRKNLEKNEKKYRSLFTSLQEGVYLHEIVYDENGKAIDYRIIDANPVSEKYLSIKNEYAVGKLATELYGTPNAPFLDIYTKVAESGEPYSFQQYFEPMKKHFLVSVFSPAKGQFATAFLDVTKTIEYENEIVAAKEKAEESELRFKAITEKAMDGIALTDIQGNYIFVNPAFCNMVGFSQEELLHMNVKELKPSEEEERHFQKLKNFGFNIESNIKLLRKDKSIIYVDLTAKVFELAKEKVALGIMHNVTDRVKAEKELLLAKEKAEESDRLKTAFLQNMSHEIRTPMNAIMGFSELLSKNFYNKAKLERFSTIINQRCNDLLDIINEILDISKIESGQLPIKIEECNLADLFAELEFFFSEYQKRIKKQHLNLRIQTVCEPTDNLIITDKVKLKQIYINLISNALKFTEKGVIDVGCKYDSHQNIIFYVSDTGIGIPLKKQNIIFDRFVQLNNDTNQATGGTGLGLSIVKGLVNLLGGEIWLNSEIGKGTTFYFTVPFKRVQSVPEIQESRSDIGRFYFSDKTILIVEDDLYNSEYIKEILSDTGLKIRHTIWGKEAIKEASELSPDLILMDIRLPDMNGYEAIKKIKENNQSLKIIAQTAYAAQEDSVKAIESGCVDYISKPLNRNHLLNLISKYI